MVGDSLTRREDVNPEADSLRIARHGIHKDWTLTRGLAKL
jgi:hypothetical protein